MFRELGGASCSTEIKRVAARSSAWTSTCSSTRTTCTIREPSSGRWTRLRELGHIFEADGATWLRTTDFGDDKDRVVIKSDGEPAYISGDLAYYLDKRERGFNRSIIMLGADHHGYVQRLMAMCAAFGDEPGVNLQILIGQMVNLVKDGQPVRMSKRAGTVVTLEDLVEIVGVDAARYALRAAPPTRTWTSTSTSCSGAPTTTRSSTCSTPMPARTTSGATRRPRVWTGATSPPRRSTHETEAALLGALQEFPRVLAYAGEVREPHRVARYLEELAGLYHRWYDNCRVIPQGDDPIEPVHRTRLWLNDATGQVLRNGLRLLGVGAPERM